MAIKEDKTRIIATISKNLKTIFDGMCKQDKRTISQEIEYILEQYYNNNSHLYPDIDKD